MVEGLYGVMVYCCTHPGEDGVFHPPWLLHQLKNMSSLLSADREWWNWSFTLILLFILVLKIKFCLNFAKCYFVNYHTSILNYFSNDNQSLKTLVWFLIAYKIHQITTNTEDLSQCLISVPWCANGPIKHQSVD